MTLATRTMRGNLSDSLLFGEKINK
ncbi:unnamed protein product [Calypogeia fissa]